MTSKMAAYGHMTTVIVMVQMKDLYISNMLWQFHSNRLNCSGDTLCWTHMLGFQL